MSAAADVVPLARPVLGEAEERAVVDVLRSGAGSVRLLGAQFGFSAGPSVSTVAIGAVDALGPTAGAFRVDVDDVTLQ